MKVYIVVKEPSARAANHFVESLGKALQAQGCEVVYGLKQLWQDEVLECDVVHFQWPEGIYGQFSHRFTEQELSDIGERLRFLKAHGKKIVCTCHNLKPHTNRDANVGRLYDLIYSHADCLHHLGAYSRDLLQPSYPNVRHEVVPHHIYDNMLSFAVEKEAARRRLGLPDSNPVILSFGKFRSDEERQFVLTLARGSHASGSTQSATQPIYLMPGFYRETLCTWNPIKLVRRLYHTIRYRLAGIRFSNELIPDDMMQCYFRAADVVLIQRPHILNSGNLPMAFAAGRAVVGPAVGNVGPILRETGNFCFEPSDIESAARSIDEALQTCEAVGAANLTYARQHWASSVVARRLLSIYQEL